VTAGYINLLTKCDNPKGEALEISTESYANRLQYSTEHNATDSQKVTYKVFTEYGVLVLVVMQDATQW
jgi:hypothetical protein